MSEETKKVYPITKRLRDTTSTLALLHTREKEAVILAIVKELATVAAYMDMRTDFIQKVAATCTDATLRNEAHALLILPIE